MPARFLIVFFLVLPLLDLLSLSFMDGFMKGWLTFALVPGIAVAGGMSAWWQWRRLWRRYENTIAPANMPTDMLLHAVLILAAGLFLITPGFVSDVLALLFLFPPTRSVLVFLIRQQHLLLQAAKFQRQFKEREKKATGQTSANGKTSSRERSGSDDFIDVEFEKK
ncbi:MAG: FxsA family protein [Planctomycetaceae bacterium]|nr:FxsA family protein [Planctomycetaceae bacterium]